MFKTTNKTLLLVFSLLLGMLFVCASAQANTRTYGVYSKSFRQFVHDEGIQELDGLDVGKEVFCGTKERKCKTDSQVCMKCTHYRSALFGAHKHQYENGKCFDYDGEVLMASKVPGASSWCDEGSFTSGVYNYETTLKYMPNGFFEQDYVKEGWGLVTLYDNEDDRVFKDKNGNAYILMYDKDEATLAYGNEESKGEEDKNITRGCEILPIKIYNTSHCFFCPLANTVFSAANEVTTLSFVAFAESFRFLITVAFALWLAYTSLQIVFTYTKQDASKYITNILKQAGKFLLAYIMLAYPQDLFDLFICPILEAGIGMADKIKALPNLDTSNYTPSAIDSGGFYNSGGLYQDIERFLASVQNQLAAMQAIGSSLFCVGGHNLFTGLSNIKENIALGFKMMFLGLILFGFAFLLSISFAFYFLDALIQLAILGAMLPMMIAGWPFKQTASYATTGLKMALNTFFVIFFTGFVVSVAILLVDSALNEINNSGFGGSGAGKGGLGGLFDAINNQNTDKIQEFCNIGAKGFLLIIFASLFGFKFVKEVTPLAQKLSGGANLGISSKVATMGASAAKGVAGKVTKPIRGSLSEKFHERGGVGGMLGRAMQAPSKWMKATGLNNTKAVKAVSNITQKAGSWVKGKGEDLTASGENAAEGKNRINGLLRRVSGKVAQKVGDGINNVGEKGLLNAVGQKLESTSVKIGKSYNETEARRAERASDAENMSNAAYKKKYGHDKSE